MIQPRASRAGASAAAPRSWAAVGAETATATVSSPAAVCAARSRATMRRPYQNPGRPSAGAVSEAVSGSAAPAGGGWDS